MKTQLTQDSQHSAFFNISEYESDSRFKKFASIDIYINNKLQKHFFMPDKEAKEIKLLHKTLKLDPELLNYLYWSFIFLDWVNDELNELLELSKAQKERFLTIEAFCELTKEIKNNQSALVEVKYTFRSSTKKEKSITIKTNPLIEIIKKNIGEFSADIELQKAFAFYRLSETHVKDLKKIKELYIMSTVFDLIILLDDPFFISKNNPFEKKKIYHLIGRILQLAGIIKSTVDDSEAIMYDNVRKIIEKFNAMKKIAATRFERK